MMPEVPDEAPGDPGDEFLDDTRRSWFGPGATTFGDRVSGARGIAGMTQAQLAGRVGVKKKILADWENDLLEPRAMRLPMLAGSLPWLLTGEGAGPGDPVETTSYLRNAHRLLAGLGEISAQMKLNAGRLDRVAEELHALRNTDAGAA